MGSLVRIRRLPHCILHIAYCILYTLSPVFPSSRSRHCNLLLTSRLRDCNLTVLRCSQWPVAQHLEREPPPCVTKGPTVASDTRSSVDNGYAHRSTCSNTLTAMRGTTIYALTMWNGILLVATLLLARVLANIIRTCRVVRPGTAPRKGTTMETLTFLRRFSERTEAQRYIRYLSSLDNLDPAVSITYRIRSSGVSHRVYKVTNIEQER